MLDATREALDLAADFAETAGEIRYAETIRAVRDGGPFTIAPLADLVREVTGEQAA